MDYLHGILRLREDTLVGLDGERHAVALEPLVGVVLRETVHQTAHEAVTTGIDGREVGADTLEGVRAVATPSPTHLDLGQHAAATLEDGDVHRGHHLLEVHGEEKARGPATYYCCLHTLQTQCLMHNS